MLEKGFMSRTDYNAIMGASNNNNDSNDNFGNHNENEAHTSKTTNNSINNNNSQNIQFQTQPSTPEQSASASNSSSPTPNHKHRNKTQNNNHNNNNMHSNHSYKNDNSTFQSPSNGYNRNLGNIHNTPQRINTDITIRRSPKTNSPNNNNNNGTNSNNRDANEIANTNGLTLDNDPSGNHLGLKTNGNNDTPNSIGNHSPLSRHETADSLHVHANTTPQTMFSPQPGNNGMPIINDSNATNDMNMNNSNGKNDSASSRFGFAALTANMNRSVGFKSVHSPTDTVQSTNRTLASTNSLNADYSLQSHKSNSKIVLGNEPSEGSTGDWRERKRRTSLKLGMCVAFVLFCFCFAFLCCCNSMSKSVITLLKLFQIPNKQTNQTKCCNNDQILKSCKRRI